MRKIYFTSVLVCSCGLIFAQSNTVSSGGDATGSGGSVSFTISQIDYISASGANGNINQGVQQPFEFFEGVGIGEHALVHINLYPNPTNQFIILNSETTLEDSKYLLIDSKGKNVTSGIIEENETKIDVRNCSSGEYHLTILSKNEIIQTLKIIKY